MQNLSYVNSLICMKRNLLVELIFIRMLLHLRFSLTQSQKATQKWPIQIHFSVQYTTITSNIQNLMSATTNNWEAFLCYVAVLSEMRVKEYLSAHPQVLEDFIMADISQEKLERWLIRKTQAVAPVTGDSNTGIHPSVSTLTKVFISKKNQD